MTNIIGVTGHRYLKHPEQNIIKILKSEFELLKPDGVITGMALGFDMLVAELCIVEGIPFVAAVPFKGQSLIWPTNLQNKYKELMKHAYKKKIVSEGSYQAWKLFKRNEWIVERSNTMLAYWDGNEKGGTYHCVSYAKKQNREFVNIFDRC